MEIAVNTEKTMAEWQPIETAPKDGTEIVVLGHIFTGFEGFAEEEKYSQRLYSCISAWYSHEDRRKSPAWSGGWCFRAPGYVSTIRPILWQPLPPSIKESLPDPPTEEL